MIVVFLVDTSPSMLRRFRIHSSDKKPEEFIGGSPFTLLDAAKATVEETVRVFSQQRPRYALFTTPIDPLHCLQSSLSENTEELLTRVKHLQAEQCGDTGACLAKVFEYLHLVRLEEGRDTLGSGWSWDSIESTHIIVLSDGGPMVNGKATVVNQLTLPGLSVPGASYFRQPFRWDQSLEVFLLQPFTGADADTQLERANRQDIIFWMRRMVGEMGGRVRALKSLTHLRTHVSQMDLTEGAWIRIHEDPSQQKTVKKDPPGKESSSRCSWLVKVTALHSHSIPNPFALPESESSVVSASSFPARTQSHPDLSLTPAEGGDWIQRWKELLPHPPWSYRLQAASPSLYERVETMRQGWIGSPPIGLVRVEESQLVLYALPFHFSLFLDLVDKVQSAPALHLPLEWRRRLDQLYVRALPSSVLPQHLSFLNKLFPSLALTSTASASASAAAATRLLEQSRKDAQARLLSLNSHTPPPPFLPPLDEVADRDLHRLWKEVKAHLLHGEEVAVMRGLEPRTEEQRRADMKHTGVVVKQEQTCLPSTQPNKRMRRRIHLASPIGVVRKSVRVPLLPALLSLSFQDVLEQGLSAWSSAKAVYDRAEFQNDAVDVQGRDDVGRKEGKEQLLEEEVQREPVERLYPESTGNSTTALLKRPRGDSTPPTSLPRPAPPHEPTPSSSPASRTEPKKRRAMDTSNEVTKQLVGLVRKPGKSAAQEVLHLLTHLAPSQASSDRLRLLLELIQEAKRLKKAALVTELEKRLSAEQGFDK